MCPALHARAVSQPCQPMRRSALCVRGASNRRSGKAATQSTRSWVRSQPRGEGLQIPVRAGARVGRARAMPRTEPRTQTIQTRERLEAAGLRRDAHVSSAGEQHSSGSRPDVSDVIAEVGALARHLPISLIAVDAPLGVSTSLGRLRRPRATRRLRPRRQAGALRDPPRGRSGQAARRGRDRSPREWGRRPRHRPPRRLEARRTGS